MATKASPMTAEDFEAYSLLPENTGRRLELVGGEVVERLASQESRRVTVQMARLVKSYLDRQPVGYATPPGIGYKVGHDRYMPDIAFVAKARQPFPPRAAYNALAPDLAFEVISPADEVSVVVAKVINYQSAGATVWTAYAGRKEIQVFIPGQPVHRLGMNDTLDGGTVLPGFSAPLEEIFEGA